MSLESLGVNVFKSGLMRDRSYSDGYGKAAITRKVLTCRLHITRTLFLVRLATPTILPATLAPCRVLRLAHHGVATVLSISRNSFVRFSSLPIAPNSLTSFGQIRPIKWGSPDCSSHLGSGIIITVSNELKPKLSL